MISALQNAVQCDNATNRLLTKWRHHRAWLVALFPIYFAATVVRTAARAIHLQRSSLPLERLVPAVGRRFHRYLRVIGVPFDYIVYSYSLYGSLCAVRWVNRLPASERVCIVARLEASSENTQGVLISLLGASRKIGNPNNRLAALCESVINTASNSDRIELVLRIDDDDDLLYYLAIKDQFSPRLSIRFVVGDRQSGYRGLHHLVSDCLPYLSDSSELVFGVADDCRMIRVGWDDAILAASREYPDNIVFINTGRDLELPYDEREVFLWLLWCWGPPSLFTAVGRKVLDVTSNAATHYPGWTPYGNSVMCDSFFEALQYYIWQATGERRAPLVTDTIALRHDILIPAHKEGGLMAASPVAFESYKGFLSGETQAVIKDMALRIAKEMRNARPETERSDAVTAGSSSL